ncbi:hypothetical protein Scep_002855 [Stephania cephalantha]|uniref:Protein kinase domain-containing protein n=1 Tax=Stephania cephalantha TaxID=152367 RepID=A0AAP0Q693_9MAGN
MATQTQTTTTTTTTTMEEFSYEDLEKATNNFSLSSLIGKGSHGCVYKGQNLHAQLSNNLFNIVAIKKPSLALQILQDNSKLDNEIDVLSSLPSSPYLVNLIGLTRRHDNSATTLNNNNNNKVLVMEFMPNSSLHHLLHHTDSTQPSWPTRALIALQLARALQFLHDLPESSSVVHRDVKPSNILFDSNWNAKLADFGLALRLQTTESSPLHDSLSPPAGTIGYIDPTYTTPSKLSVKNDVYSFGVVLLEIVSSRRAIDVEMDPASVVEWALPLIKADRMDDIIDRRAIPPASVRSSIMTMLSVAARCVELEQNLRPNMREVVTELMNSVLVNVERTRFPPLIKSLIMRISRRHRRRKEAARTTVILCSAKMSIREVLAETQ